MKTNAEGLRDIHFQYMTRKIEDRDALINRFMKITGCNEKWAIAAVDEMLRRNQPAKLSPEGMPQDGEEILSWG